ncbi:TonB-dependent receptor [Rodentibacter caecimuris]|uniref:Ligand-gated channel protein n=1 Tax=Rodentibacter caecimuris TaxID=1796644 RepID=A0ABX3KY18_9PAST|nr:ligand-gated channel protein [Rodentibacter heylii]
MRFKHKLIHTALFIATPISVSAENTQLEQINVVTELETFKAANGTLKDDVNLSLLGKQPAFTSPISVINYDEKAFSDKEPRNVVDALAKTDASVMNFGGETNTLQGVYVRGLQLDARQFSVNGLAGLYSTYNSPTAGVSSAQLIKGASTATVGMDPEGSSGASINIETKRATDEPINKIGFAWFSNNRLQPSFDFGRRFGKNNEWGIRLNGKYRDGSTPRHDFDEINKEFAVGADYRSEKVRIGVDYMYTKRATNGGRARVQDIQSLDFALPKAPNGKINLIPHWSGQTTEDQTAMLTFEYDLPYDMMLSGGIGHLTSKYYGSFGQVRMISPNNKNYTQVGDAHIQQMRAIDYRQRTTSANLKLQGSLITGEISHSWNLSFDKVVRYRDFDQSTILKNQKVNIYDLYRYNSNYRNAPTFTELKQGSTDEKLMTQSFAIADTLGFIQDQIRFTLGGRLQGIKQNDYSSNIAAKSKRFSPMFTLAWVPNVNLVLYGNYLEDLEPGSVDEDGVMAKPIVSRQIEVGARKNWGNIFTTTLSLYQIARPGIITAEAAKAGYGKPGEEQGKERNRGVEFNIYANLLNSSLRPTLGITYNQGKLIDYASFAGNIINGAQVASPRIIAKAGIEWDTPFLQGLTLNTALQYYSKSYQDYAKNYKFPSYTTVDLGAKYQVKLHNKQILILRTAIENLFNESYWQVQRGRYDRSFAVLGMPRTYWFKAEYSF